MSELLTSPGAPASQPIGLPCSSQCAATFFDGCTRGGSPGIFGEPTG
jgi:hypothetical protein